MKAGRLTEFLIPMHLVTETDPESGAITRRWVEEKVIRADRTRSSVKAEMRGPEGFIQADAVYYIRIQDHVEDGWRVRDRTDGKVYDVVTDRCTDKSMLMLKCTKVND